MEAESTLTCPQGPDTGHYPGVKWIQSKLFHHTLSRIPQRSTKCAVVDVSLNSPGGTGVTIITGTTLSLNSDAKLAPCSEMVHHPWPRRLRPSGLPDLFRSALTHYGIISGTIWNAYAMYKMTNVSRYAWRFGAFHIVLSFTPCLWQNAIHILLLSGTG